MIGDQQREKERDVFIEHEAVSNKIVPLFRIFDQVTTTSVGSILQFPYIKMMIALTPLHVALTESEFEKHNIYQGMSRFLVALLGPEMDRLDKNTELGPAEKDELRDAFKDLRAKSRSCGIVQLSLKQFKAGQVSGFEFETATSTRRAKSNAYGGTAVEEERIGMGFSEELKVECPEGLAELGRDMARDNGYNLINCEAVETFYGLLGIVTRLGLLSFDDKLVIDNREAKPEELRAQEARMREARNGR